MSKIGNLDLTRPPKKTANRSRNQYAAAKTDRLTGAWSPTTADVNDIIGASSTNARARVRQLVRDNPHFSRAVELTSTYQVGAGIKYQSQIKDSNGKLKQDLNQYIETKWENWLKIMDIAGRMHGNDFQDLCNRQSSECGEYLLIERYENVKKGEMPLRYQSIEPDQLSTFHDSSNSSTSKDNEITQGIEYNVNTGKLINYYFQVSTPQNLYREFKIPADKIIHGLHVLRPNQLRGISPFVSGVLTADAFLRFLSSELSRKNMAARWMAFVSTHSPQKFQDGLSTNLNGDKIEEYENLTIKYIDPMENITIPSIPQDAGMKDFTEIVLHMYSVSTGLPYELLTQNYGRISFSTARIGRTDFRQELKPKVARFIRQMLEPIKQRFFEIGVLSGYLDLRGDIDQYMIGRWQPPGMEPIDALKEVKAVVSEIESGLKSPQEYIVSRGEDPETVLLQIKEFKEMAAAHGLEFATAAISTMMQNNDAKIEPDLGEQDG